MAPLNPTINPTNDPNYRGYSSPINVPDTIKPQGVQQNQILPKGQEIGDRSAEYEGKAAGYKAQADATNMEVIGDLFKNLTQMGDFIGKASVAVTKKEIEDKVYQVADRERQEYTETLEKIKNSGVSNILNPSSGEGDGGGDTPDEVASLGDTLSTLKSARDSGKITSAYYQGRLLAEAKKLRAQYPGFKNEIDNEFAKVTGVNPANAYIRSLTMDINRGASAASSEVKKAENFILQRNGYPNAGVMLRAVQTGQAGLKEAMDWAAPFEREDYELKRKAAVFQDNKIDRETQQMKVGELADYAMGVAVNRMVTAHAGRMGIASAEDAMKLDSASKAGVIPQQQWTQWGQDLARTKAELDLQMTRDGLSSGAIKILGREEFNRRKTAALSQVDNLIDRIYNKDVGGYHRLEQDLKSINDETKKSILTHPKIGPPMRQYQAFKDIGGESNLQQFNLELIKGDFASDYKTYFGNFQKAIATQLSVTDGKGVTTFSDWIDDLKQKGFKDKKLNSAVMKEINKVTDGTIPEQIRMNYAKGAFDPANRGMLEKIAEGEGRQKVFLDWTSEQMTKTMFELGKKDPQLWKNYVDWTQETLAKSLLNKEINTLAEIRNPHIRVGWDTDNKRFVPVYDTTRSAGEISAARVGAPTYNTRSGAEDPEFNNVVRITNRMNSNISNYKNIATAAGIDPDTFILRTIAAERPDALQNINSIPYNILRDIGLAKTKGIGSK